MPYTVPVSFDEFIKRISLTGDHKEIAEARRKRIVSLLEKSFTILDSFPTGSIPKGTALKSHADLDVIVVLHYSKHIKDKTTKQVLQSVRDALAEYRTNVRKNGQAVTLHYDSWPDVDIVPVSRTTNDDGSVNCYNVPDMTSGKWLPARPRKHASALADLDAKYDSHFKPLIRMIKQWNKVHSDLMESYHIEVLAMQCLSSSLADYSWSTFQFFDMAIPLVEKSLPYEGGYADDYLTVSVRQEVLKRLRTARDQARIAWSLTYDSKVSHKEAIAIWGNIFGDKFPAYG